MIKASIIVLDVSRTREAVRPQSGVLQGATWNGSGFMRNVVETVTVTVARAMRIIALLVVLCAASPVLAETPIALKSFSVSLPDGLEMFAGGPAAEAVNNNCLTCHSREMVTVQPPLSAAAWAATVEKMRKVYKAPVSDEDAAAIVRYLTAIRGTK